MVKRGQMLSPVAPLPVENPEKDELQFKLAGKRRIRTVAWANALLKDIEVGVNALTDVFDVPSNVEIADKGNFAQLKKVKARWLM